MYHFKINTVIELKYEIEKRLEQCDEGFKTLESILRHREKKYKPNELSNKRERLERVKENIEVLKDLYTD